MTSRLARWTPERRCYSEVDGINLEDLAIMAKAIHLLL